jgi:hypothetical protein
LLPGSFAPTKVGVGFSTGGEPEAGRPFILQGLGLAGEGEAWGVPWGVSTDGDAGLVGKGELEEGGDEGDEGEEGEPWPATRVATAGPGNV